MAHSKQASKRIRTSEEARKRNKTLRSRMRSSVKAVASAPSGEAAQKALPEAMRRIDKAAKRGVIHKNAAARHKSRLARAARAAAAQPK
ncbi:MAG TPA: 30S ribosomal protein S20 [Planctomycetota bacterium]|nr:30S ribosomal protein S20 [Planctomycetota bacterium]